MRLLRQILTAAILVFLSGHTMAQRASSDAPRTSLPNAAQMVRDGVWRDRFVAVLGSDHSAFTALLEVTSPAEQEGDLIVASGCVRFICSIRYGTVAAGPSGVYALSKVDGRERLYGQPNNEIVEILRRKSPN
jgi:hypothetical protein